MQRYMPAALAGLAIALLFWRQQGQQAALDSLQEEVRLLHADVDPAGVGVEPGALGASEPSPQAAEAAARPGAAPRQPGSGEAAGSDGSDAPESQERVGDWTQQPPEAMHDELLEILASDDPAVRARVREVVEAAEQERRDERREQRQERWETRTLQSLDTLAQQVSLSQQQQDALFAILTVARDRATDAFRQSREAGGDRVQVRAQMQKFRDDAQAEARELLDGNQYEAFDQMMQDERTGGWRGGGRPGRGSAP